jgi:hypothetical protein
VDCGAASEIVRDETGAVRWMWTFVFRFNANELKKIVRNPTKT